LVEDAEKASQCRAHPEAPTNAISASLAAEIGELNDAEQKIRLAWGSLLYMNPLDIPAHLSFYAAGGHSVLAIQLVADLRSSGIPLTLAELHAHNTIEHQVHFAVNHALCTADPTAKQTDQPFALVAAGTSTSELISKIADEYPISRDRIENVYPCTALQQGLIAASLQKPGRYICDFRFRLR
ncbi:acyl carrier protein, partial [Clavibacter michiganensis]|uniref:acyl carrier protein n=1 Tax=Clavibacter michiganensis TaxID=28447 RepID=UPI00293184F8